MLREPALKTTYLPPYLQEYKEIAGALDAADPEFSAVWSGADRVLRNEFIATADESGIERFEKLLGLLPFEDDNLESRRARVQINWFSALPYTMKMLIKKLTVLCGGDDFKITKSFNKYKITVATHLRLYSQILSLREVLEEMIPVNMVIQSNNSIIVRADGAAKIYTGLRLTGKHKKIQTEVKNYGVE